MEYLLIEGILMARIYWDILDCGGKTECCCHCPHFNIDNRRKYPQQCYHPDLKAHIKGLTWRNQSKRSIDSCQTPEWCPLPKLEFPEYATRIINVSPVFEYKEKRGGQRNTLRRIL